MVACTFFSDLPTTWIVAQFRRKNKHFFCFQKFQFNYLKWDIYIKYKFFSWIISKYFGFAIYIHHWACCKNELNFKLLFVAHKCKWWHHKNNCFQAWNKSWITSRKSFWKLVVNKKCCFLTSHTFKTYYLLINSCREGIK